MDGWNDIVQVGAGTNHTVGLKRDGTVVAVGWDFYGQVSRVFDWDLDKNECEFSISPTSVSIDSDGGTDSVTVTCASECPWEASSDEDWITITSGPSGIGNGDVFYDVEENPSKSIRIGTMTIAGETFYVTQGGYGCTYSISPIETDNGSDGGTGSITIIVHGGCSWTASSMIAGLPSHQEISEMGMEFYITVLIKIILSQTAWEP